MVHSDVPRTDHDLSTLSTQTPPVWIRECLKIWVSGPCQTQGNASWFFSRPFLRLSLSVFSKYPLGLFKDGNVQSLVQVLSGFCFLPNIKSPHNQTAPWFSWGQRCRSSTTNSSSFTIRTRTGEVVFPTWRHLVWLAADVHGSFSLRGNPFCGVTCFGEKWHLTHDAFDPRVFRTI